MTTRTKPNLCVSCGEMLDAASHMTDDAKPSPGDGSVCWYCGHLSVYADDLTLRPPNDQEMHELAGDKRVLELQAARSKYASIWPNDTLKTRSEIEQRAKRSAAAFDQLFQVRNATQADADTAIAALLHAPKFRNIPIIHVDSLGNADLNAQLDPQPKE